MWLKFKRKKIKGATSRRALWDFFWIFIWIFILSLEETGVLEKVSYAADSLPVDVDLNPEAVTKLPKILENQTIYDLKTPKYYIKPSKRGDLNLLLQVGGTFNSPTAVPSGGVVRFGFQGSIVGMDISYRHSQLRFGNFFALPNLSDIGTLGVTAQNQVPYANINPSNPWNLDQLGIGIRLLGPWLTEVLPQLHEFGRIGASYSTLFDLSGGTGGYAGVLFDTDVGLQFKVNPTEPYSINLALVYTFGLVGNSGQQTQLPVAMLGMTASFVIDF